MSAALQIGTVGRAHLYRGSGGLRCSVGTSRSKVGDCSASGPPWSVCGDTKDVINVKVQSCASAATAMRQMRRTWPWRHIGRHQRTVQPLGRGRGPLRASSMAVRHPQFVCKIQSTFCAPSPVSASEASTRRKRNGSTHL